MANSPRQAGCHGFADVAKASPSPQTGVAVAADRKIATAKRISASIPKMAGDNTEMGLLR
jgi:hypothetical protein